MDNRYYFIIFIALISILALYFIEDSSYLVGSGSVNFDKYTFSIPHGFALTRSDDTVTQIYNPDFGFVAFGFSANDDYQNSLNNIYNSSDTLLKNGTVSIGNTTVYSIYYSDIDDKGVLVNRSVFFFDEYNKSFKISMSYFDYDTQSDESIDILSYIINSLHENHAR